MFEFDKKIERQKAEQLLDFFLNKEASADLQNKLNSAEELSARERALLSTRARFRLEHLAINVMNIMADITIQTAAVMLTGGTSKIAEMVLDGAISLMAQSPKIVSFINSEAGEKSVRFMRSFLPGVLVDPNLREKLGIQELNFLDSIASAGFSMAVPFSSSITWRSALSIIKNIPVYAEAVSDLVKVYGNPIKNLFQKPKPVAVNF